MVMVEYERMRDADFLYHLYIYLRGQIKDEELDPKKEYDVRVKGLHLVMLAMKAKAKYRKSKRLKDYVMGRRPYRE